MKVIEAVGQILFLVMRGLMLWGLIPFALLAWLLGTLTWPATPAFGRIGSLRSPLTARLDQAPRR